MVLGGALALPFVLPATAQAQDAVLRSAEIADGVFLITGAGANVTAARTADGAVLVDAGSAAAAPALAEEALRVSGTDKAAAVINTCWRPAYTGGNDLFGARNIPIISHENTRLWMGTEIWSRWEDRTYAPRAPQALPTKTFYTEETLAPGGLEISCGYLQQAHTDGDIYARLNRANVLAIGGLASKQRWPVIDWATGGWMGGLTWGLETLIEVSDEDTIIVPAYGPVMTRADLSAQHRMHTDLFAKLKVMMESGYSPERVVEEKPAAEYEAQLGDASQYLTLAFQSFWGHVRQFDVV
jgi:cyclase